MSSLSISVPEAISEFQKGNPLIILDQETRENEGDLVIPAEKISPKMVNLFITLGRGLLCSPVSPEIAHQLNFHPMVENAEPHTCNFAVSVDGRKNFHTGISATERCNTILEMLNPKATPQDFIRPGHIFPVLAKKGGVLERPGHTETTVDLCKLSGMKSVGMICEILNEDGTMARLPQLQKISQETGIKLFTVETLIQFMKKKNCLSSPA